MAADKDSGAGGSASAEIGKYLDILAKDPNSRVFAPLAEAYRKAGLLDDAIETAREGLSVHPNYLGGRVALGRALFEKKRLAEAAEEMRKVVRAAPDNIIAHKVLGQIALAQGSLPDAETSFRMVVLLDPHDKEAKQVLADIGAGGLAPAASPVASAPPQPASIPPPAADKLWGEVSLEGAPAFPGIELHRAPADAAPAAPPPEPFPMEDITVGPSAIELEGPDEGPEPLPDIDAPTALHEGEPLSPAADASGQPAIEMVPAGLEGPPPAAPAAFEVPELPAVEPSELPATAEREDTAEIEIFGREPAGTSIVAATGASDAMPAESPASGTPLEDESPFEIFGRSRRGGPFDSAKGERGAYAEIEIEPAGNAAAAAEPEADQGPVFEIFTREPRVEEGGAPRSGSVERPPLEQIDVEPTAYLPSEPQGGGPPVLELREEIPCIDVQRELELALEVEREPREVQPEVAQAVPAEAVAAESAPLGEEIGWEEESPWQAEFGAAAADAAPLLTPVEAATEELVWDAEPEPAATPVVEPAAETALELAAEPAAAAVEEEEVLTLEEEIPSVDLAGEVAASPEVSAAAGRGVFDTETLATIYINQGFYGRAAAIYERLAAASPEDSGLRQKLEEVRELERANAGASAARPAAPEATPAGRDRAETIRRLEALLAAFREVGAR